MTAIAQGANIKLVEKGKKNDQSIDAKINKNVEPLSSAVSDFIFYSFRVKEEVVFNEVISEGNSEYRNKPPFRIEYSDELPVRQSFQIKDRGGTMF